MNQVVDIRLIVMFLVHYSLSLETAMMGEMHAVPRLVLFLHQVAF